MKIYIDSNKIFFIGKVAQLREYLNNCALQYATVKEMIAKSLH